MPNGGFNNYARRYTKKLVAHPYPEPRTITVTVAGGQVIKANSWLTRLDTGKVVVHTGLSFSQSFQVSGVNPAVAGDTFVLTLNSAVYTLTVSAGKTLTAEEVVQAFVTGVSGKGVITASSGASPYSDILKLSPGTISVTLFEPTLLVFSQRDFDASNSGFSTLTFTTASSTLSIAAAGGGTGSPSAIANVLSNRDPIAGLLLYDVVAKDASGSPLDTQAQAFVSGSFWADGVHWSADSTVETITDADGVTHPVTSYHTGCSTDLAYQAFVGGTEFNIVTQLEGEKEI